MRARLPLTKSIPSTIVPIALSSWGRVPYTCPIGDCGCGTMGGKYYCTDPGCHTLRTYDSNPGHIAIPILVATNSTEVANHLIFHPDPISNPAVVAYCPSSDLFVVGVISIIVSLLITLETSIWVSNSYVLNCMSPYTMKLLPSIPALSPSRSLSP